MIMANPRIIIEIRRDFIHIRYGNLFRQFVRNSAFYRLFYPGESTSIRVFSRLIKKCQVAGKKETTNKTI